MDVQTLIGDLLKISIPAAVVLYAMYMTFRVFAQKEMQQIQAQLQLRETDLAMKREESAQVNKEQTLPIRLQAYERMCLFLERISPAQLVPRMNNDEFSVGLLQQILIREIRNEYAHNLSQQMYMSDQAWILIKRAMEEMIVLINNTAMSLDEDSAGINLAKKILENVRDHDINPTHDALQFLKDEIRHLF